MIKKDGPLTTNKIRKTRTDFTKPRLPLGVNLSADEKRFYNFLASKKKDVQDFVGNETFSFLNSWLKDSIDYYKEALCSPTTADTTALRGIIHGQKEIQAMLLRIEQANKKKAEVK